MTQKENFFSFPFFLPSLSFFFHTHLKKPCFKKKKKKKKKNRSKKKKKKKMAEEKENKKVCIFGANGFIGSHITKHLLEKGYTVIAITRSPPEEEKVSFLSRKENFPEQERLSLLQCSTDDTKELVKRMGGCKSCIIASGINDPAYETWPEEMVQLTENVLNCCSEVGVERVVLLTSTGTTNPREGEPLEKKEDVHFSDPVLQREQGKFASCAKTLAGFFFFCFIFFVLFFFYFLFFIYFFIFKI